jgi:CPA1 family monovalent cation:H+ antiporter
MQDRLKGMQEKMVTPEGTQETFAEVNRRGRAPSERTLDQFTRRVTQGLADIEYFKSQPLGWREGTAVVWAGMRGAVTVAAAQTLPIDTPQRSVLVLIAFAVAALSLLVQGGTIGPLLRLIAPKVDDAAAAETQAELTRVMQLVRSAGETVPEPAEITGEPTQEMFQISKKHRLAVLHAQRAALLDARDNGTFDADMLTDMLATLDAAEISIELRGKLAS